MANDRKYHRLYPERAVAPLRDLARDLLEAAGDWAQMVDALSALEDGFPPDEPLFLLRGQDQLAADIVRHYADAVQIEDAFGGLEKNATVIEHLHDHADRMERWRPRKLPD